MSAVLNAALPVFALILTGFLCGRFKMFDRRATDSLNRFAFYLALPALLFAVATNVNHGICDDVRNVSLPTPVRLKFSCSTPTVADTPIWK